MRKIIANSVGSEKKNLPSIISFFENFVRSIKPMDFDFYLHHCNLDFFEK